MMSPFLPELDTLRDRVAQARDNLTYTHSGSLKELERVLQVITSWQLMHATQERPRVLGLWGMTGTGKSSMVRTILETLGLDKRTCWLDAGECRRGEWLEQHMELLRTHGNGAPFVVVVDEFHQARTVKAGTEQDESPELRRMWELIDAGRVVLMPGYRRLDDLLDLRDSITKLLSEGMLVRKGIVVEKLDAFKKAMALHMHHRNSDEPWVLPVNTWSYFQESNSGTISLTAFQHRLSKLNGNGVLDLLDQAIQEARNPHVFDARQALVIVLGNLDELYVMGREPLPALDPDVLLARHEKLGTAGVHRALMGLFRIEQVARLGTEHVILPPMGRSTMQRMVKREARRLAARSRQELGIRISVGQGLLDRIASQAAIPVLGARPVVEAVQQVIPALVSQVLMHRWVDPVQGIMLDVNPKGNWGVVDLGREKIPVALRWPLVRFTGPEPPPENTLRYAVHEAGHLICGMRLCQSVPLQACVRTGDTRTAGFVAWQQNDEPLTKRDIVPALAQLLGGHLAEELIYGVDGASMGSDDDLQKASAMALDLIRDHGMGEDLRFHVLHPDAPGNGFRLGLQEVERQAQRWLEEATTLARKTLLREKGLLERLAARLAEAGSMGRVELERFMGCQPALQVCERERAESSDEQTAHRA